MKNRMKLVMGLVLGIMLPLSNAHADNSGNLSELSAQWWQWALSIPTAQNPQLDTTGANCMIGERGPVWFLAGVFGGGAATRSCSIPADTTLFFPVVNSVQINTPNVCGSGPGNVSVRDLRQAASAGLAGTTFSVEMDGKPFNGIVRIQSDVFATVLPGDNVFDAPCGGPGTVPAGIYSPSVDDGFYALLNSLKIGQHTLRIRAQGPVPQDVTYQLTVVPVSDK
jgi:hypothetical protein